jgi:hypothetical protein
VKPAISIKIVRHPASRNHWLAKVYSGRYVYAVTWADPSPSQTEVELLWLNERRAFRAYDEVSGRYL